MSFLSIAFLMALPLAAAPLLLHLFDRRRNQVIEWGAMEFLMEATARKTSARRLKQWLLLLLRCLAIAALIFALSRPLLPSGYLGGNNRGETIFVIDNSMSMMRSTERGTMMDDATAYAIGELADLPRGESVRILTAAPYPVWGRAGGLRNERASGQRIKTQLEQLKATEGRSDLLAALFTAVQAEHDPTQASRRIVVLTDGQAADWRLQDEAGWKRLQQVLSTSPVRTEIELVRLDSDATPAAKGNLAIERLSVGRTIVGVDQPITLHAHLHNYDAADSASTLVWNVNGSQTHEESVDGIEIGQSRETPWNHSFDAPGTYRVSCRVECDDDLPADNTASLVVEVVDRVPIVIVEDAFDLAEMQQDSYFVQAALGWINGSPLNDKSIYEPTLVAPEELAAIDLSDQRVVVIPNLTRLSEDVVDKLTQFVFDGGGLWVGLGPRTDIDSFNHQLFADASGLSPLRIDRIIDSATADASEDPEYSEARQTFIDPFRVSHAATAQLADDKQLDLADALIRRRFQFVTTEDDDDLSVLLSLNNGHPLAVENFLGRGRVIVQAIPLRLQWSDLARTQSFVVMVRDWVDYLAQPRATQYNLRPGEPILFRLPESTADTKAVASEAPTALLTMPQGDAVELTAERHDDSFVLRSSRTRLPGPYQLEVGLAEQAIPFHVQRDSGESDLSPLTADARQQLSAATKADPTKERLEATASTQSDPVWPYLLFGLIFLIMGELVLSGLLARERFGSAGIPEFSELDAPLETSFSGNDSLHPSTTQSDAPTPIATEVN